MADTLWTYSFLNHKVFIPRMRCILALRVINWKLIVGIPGMQNLIYSPWQPLGVLFWCEAHTLIGFDLSKKCLFLIIGIANRFPPPTLTVTKHGPNLRTNVEGGLPFLPKNKKTSWCSFCISTRWFQFYHAPFLPWLYDAPFLWTWKCSSFWLLFCKNAL